MKTKIFLFALLSFFAIKMNAQCSAQFTYTTNPNGIVNFVATSQGMQAPSYTWNFGNGSIGFGAVTTSNYNSNGYYYVCVTATDTANGTGGCSITYCDSVIINGGFVPCSGMPSAGNAIASNNSPTSGSSVTYSVPNATFGNGITYQWQKSYPNSAYFNLIGSISSTHNEICTTACYRCIVTCANSGLSDTSAPVCVTPLLSTGCNAAYSYSTNALTGSLTFTANTTGNSNTSTYTWTGNLGFIGSGTNLTTNLPIGGNYVCLIVEDTITNCFDSTCQYINISNPTPCSAAFNYTINPNGTVTFNATGNNSASTIYSWNLGGGGSSNNSSTTTATYSNPGFYSVCLVVTDPLSNCQNVICQNITITLPSSPCNPIPFSQTTNSNGSVTLSVPNGSNTASYYWNCSGMTLFGNPITYTGNSCMVCLTVIDSLGGCPIPITYYCDSVYVNSNPSGCSAAFTYTPNSSNSGVLNATNIFTNSSNIWYTWTVDGMFVGNNGQSQSVSLSNGVHTICLFTIDSFNNVINCMDSSCQTITVNNTSSPCSAAFAYSINPSSGLQVYSTNVTTIGMNYTWLLAGNVIATGISANLPLPAGTYNICLATSLPGSTCTDTTCQTITISNLPCSAGYFIYPDTTGAPHTYIGVNTSTGTGLSYLWSWGDGTTSTGQYPSHTYASAGNYLITLVVDNGAGCVDTFSSPQSINKTSAMYSINFANPTSVKSVTKELATIYPNPAKDNFTIKGLATAKYQVEIMNLNGSILKSVSANGNQAINISSLANNIYILKITNQDGTTQFAKLIKD